MPLLSESDLSLPHLGRILVTGGAGFIGSHIARELHARGCPVVVLDNLSTGKFENIADIAHQIDWIEGDILDIDLINRILPGVSAVCHQAALPSVPRSLKNPEKL